MADFIVTFEDSYYAMVPFRFFDYTKEEVITQAKKIANEKGYRSFHLTYMGSGKSVGYWQKRGSRWYKEW